jgi:hypothetical protein
MRPPMKSLILSLCAFLPAIHGLPTLHATDSSGREISQSLFTSLEELARIVDISYCVGTSGIRKPFSCLSRCSDFDPGFELLTTWNTGPLLSDSSGYIALSHAPFEKRVIVAFRGTYSIANTVADLSTRFAEYAPFPSDADNDSVCVSGGESFNEGTTGNYPETPVNNEHAHPNDKEPLLPQLLRQQPNKRAVTAVECPNCTVHSGFMTSWRNTRCIVVPPVEKALQNNPGYKLVLVGHSLGGAVAALASLEFQARGWDPIVTTFGEPRVGNKALNEYIDRSFNLSSNATTTSSLEEAKYRRVTHVDDPVPLLPLEEWGYRMHGGEIFISKASLPPTKDDLYRCAGDEDPDCIDSKPASLSPPNSTSEDSADDISGEESTVSEMWHLGSRYKLWELFFAHRDYFWRLGLCVPGGDPWDWRRARYNETEPQEALSSSPRDE